MTSISDIRVEVDLRSRKLVLPLILDRLKVNHYKNHRDECSCPVCHNLKMEQYHVKYFIVPFEYSDFNSGEYLKISNKKEKREYIRNYFRNKRKVLMESLPYDSEERESEMS